ncbi:MAG: hypothetical protein ACYDAP_06585 [Thermoplasmataceae archaeon]
MTLYIDEILSKHDFPLLATATDNLDRKWILSWADTNEKSGDTGESGAPIIVEDKWFAIPTSDERFLQILEEHLSLREAILFYETDLFLVTANRPLFKENDIKEIKKISRNEIPMASLPLMDISIKGTNMMPDVGDHSIIIQTHIIPGTDLEGLFPLEIIAPLTDYLQKIFRWSSNFIKKGKSRELFIPKDNLGKLNFVSLQAGSIIITTETREIDREKNKPFLKALEHIKGLVESNNPLKSLDIVERNIGREALLNIHFLLNLQIQQKININFKYASSSGIFNCITLSYKDAESVLRALNTYFRKKISSTGLIIKLTPEDKEKLMRPVTGEGGWQSLARQLKRQIRDDDSLIIDQRQLERIIRYSQSYGEGGWQERLEVILVELRRLGLTFSQLR